MHRAGPADPGIARDDAQDLSRTLSQHLPPGGPCAVEAAVENDPNDRVPAVGRHVFGAGNEVSRGVVDEHVEPAGFGHDGVDDDLNGLGIADVSGVHERPTAICPNLRSHRLKPLGIAGHQRNRRARLREAQCEAAADAGAAAGDHGYPAFDRTDVQHGPGASSLGK